MPKILNTYDGPVGCSPCDPRSYEDKSLYFEDASVIIDAIDMRKVRSSIAEQIHNVVKYADSESVTSEELLNEINKLRDQVRNLVVLERLAK